jgi:phospholysine phosphohistidine inorganic pyrophosphate phosphatase
MTPIADFRGVIFDIDGVLEYQGRAYPGAAEIVTALRQKGMRLCFLTNSTLKNRRSAAEKLQKKGVEVFPEEVITASSAAAEYLRRLQPRSIYLMLDREGVEEFAAFPQDNQHPEYVVVGDNRSRFDFDHLNHALRLLARGAQLIGMQAELVDSSLGELELNVGSWAGMLERASGVPAVYTGKPAPFAFELALQLLGVEPGQALVVGDRVSTDIAGAKAIGLASALIRTGEFRPADLDGPVQPDYVYDSIHELLSLF